MNAYEYKILCDAIDIMKKYDYMVAYAALEDVLEMVEEARK